MSSIENGRARAVADLAEGLILASVEIAAPPERVFRALVSKEVCEWWGRPGVFDTREWTGDARVVGRWRASGMDTERPYVIEGEFLAVDPPRKLAHTWHSVGARLSSPKAWKPASRSAIPMCSVSTRPSASR